MYSSLTGTFESAHCLGEFVCRLFAAEILPILGIDFLDWLRRKQGVEEQRTAVGDKGDRWRMLFVGLVTRGLVKLF